MAAAEVQAAQEIIVLDGSSGDEAPPVSAGRRSGGRGAGPSRAPQQAGQHRQHQQQRQPGRRPREEGASEQFVDLTESPPESPRLEVVSSTVAPKALKRPRLSSKAGLQALIDQARNPPPPPPPPPEPKGIKCGICMEVMGGGSARPMASGPCGHVYCRDCLTEAVRAQKKCPSCRKNLQLRQLHQVFVEFT